jgi:SRSO17 transposase
MKPSHHTTPDPVGTTQIHRDRWLVRLQQLHQRLRPYFARPEPYQHVLLYLQAILSEIPRKNGWQIAEHAGQARPYGIQRLLSQAAWDQEGVRDELRKLVAETLHAPLLVLEPPASETPFPVLVIDESGLPKRGEHSAGVAVQYCGRTGRLENCQVGVFLSYVTKEGHALIDRELYLPEDWCVDLPRRRAAHIPDSLTFQTKPELALHMIRRASEALLPIRWVVADTVYGHSPTLRTFLEAQGYASVLAVPNTEVVCVQTRAGPLLRDVGSIAATLTHVRDWQRLSQSQGTKGERLFDWSILPWLQAGRVDGCHFLLLRRCLDPPQQLAYYLVCAPPATPLPIIVQAIGARWRVEEDLQLCKHLGMDQYEVRSYRGWYRHVTLVLLAAAFLVSLCVQQKQGLLFGETTSRDPPRIPLSTRELHRLLARLLFPIKSSLLLVERWLVFRQTHQYWAGYYHRRRRAKVG